jgi:hypothetical protein
MSDAAVSVMPYRYDQNEIHPTNFSVDVGTTTYQNLSGCSEKEASG